MVLSVQELRKEICESVTQGIEKEYNELRRLNDFPKDDMWINQFWIRYVKNTEIQITRRGPGIERTVAPIYKFVPEPTGRIRHEDIRFPSAIFDTGSIEPFLRDLDSASKRVMMYLLELIITCLTSSRQEIPSMTEVKENLNVNFQGFLALVEQRNEKVCSIAPINGIEFTDIITDESVRFSEPTVQDLQILK